MAPLPSVPAPGRTDSARVEDLPGSHASPPDLGRGVQRGSPGVRAGHPAPWRCALTSPGAGAPPGKGGQLISGHPANGPPKAPKPEPVERTAADAPHSGTSSLECGGIPAKPGNSGVFWGPRRPADPLTQGPEPQAAGVCARTPSPHQQPTSPAPFSTPSMPHLRPGQLSRWPGGCSPTTHGAPSHPRHRTLHGTRSQRNRGSPYPTRGRRTASPGPLGEGAAGPMSGTGSPCP